MDREADDLPHAQVEPADPFDSLLDLEEKFYADGKAKGTEDGAEAGLIEGRVFGLEKGFEKFLVMGVLAGRCAVWEARMSTSDDATSSPAAQTSAKKEPETSKVTTPLPKIPATSRLAKHLEVLHALTDEKTVSTSNDEDAVSAFDERMKHAQGKAKVVERLVGDAVGNGDGESNPQSNQNMEDFRIPSHLTKVAD